MSEAEVYAAFMEIRSKLEAIQKGFVSAHDITPADGCASYCFAAALVRMNDLMEALPRTMVSVAQLARNDAAGSNGEPSTKDASAQ